MSINWVWKFLGIEESPKKQGPAPIEPGRYYTADRSPFGPKKDSGANVIEAKDGWVRYAHVTASKGWRDRKSVV